MSEAIDSSSAQTQYTTQRFDRSRRQSTTWRAALFVFVVSGIFWLGGSYIRAMIGNELLRFGTLEFEEYIAPEAEREVFRLLSFASLSMIISYCIAFASSIVFLTTCPFRLKEHGWLMMSAILFYLFVPVEAFIGYLDARMIYQELFTTADNVVFRELFRARLGALAGTPFIATLSYYTIIALAVFQPLRNKQHHTL